MAVSVGVFDKYIERIAQSSGARFRTGTNVVVALLDSSWTPDSTATDIAALLTHEVPAGGGYFSVATFLTYHGGSVKTAPTFQAWDDTDKWAVCGMDDVVWPSLSRTPRYAVFIESWASSLATSTLLFWVDFGADEGPAGGSLTIAWPVWPGGVLNVVAA